MFPLTRKWFACSHALRGLTLATVVAALAFTAQTARAADCSGQFGDFVWYDLNGDGIQDPGEPGIEGVELSLYDADDNLLQTTTTGPNGAYYLYYFTICGETYKIVLNEDTIPDGLIPTIEMAGSDPEADSNANPVVAVLPLPPVGENFTEDLSIDFGFVDEPVVCEGQIGDFVWYDLNGNGLQESGEPGIADVEVLLYDVNNMLIGSTTTDENGLYYFTDGVYCGETYTVEVNIVTLPDGLVPTVVQAGDEELDSNANPFTLTLPVPPDGEYFIEDLTIDFGFVEETEECLPCDGKVTELTLKYLGDKEDAEIVVETKRDGDAFSGVVQPDGSFTIYGVDKHGTLGTEISIYVNGVLNTKIHTSCSQPIGPGLVSGDFLVEDGASRNGGLLCPLDPEGDDCKPCDGKVTELTLAYQGYKDNVWVKVYQKDGTKVFSGQLDSGDTFYFSGADDKGTLGTEITIYVDGCKKGQFHTSCSQPIGPGSMSGDFTVLDGKSRNGGLLCEPGEEPEEPKCDDDYGHGKHCSYGWYCTKKCSKHGKCGKDHNTCDKKGYGQKCKIHGKSGKGHEHCGKSHHAQKKSYSKSCYGNSYSKKSKHHGSYKKKSHGWGW